MDEMVKFTLIRYFRLLAIKVAARELRDMKR